MIVADASVWVSLLVRQDVHHQISRRWLVALLEGPDRRIVAPTLLLVEIAGALSRRGGEPLAAVRPVWRLRHDPHFRFVGLDEQSAWESARLAALYGLRGADAVYVSVARRFSVPLLTWDGEQLSRAVRAGVVARNPDPGDPLCERPSSVS